MQVDASEREESLLAHQPTRLGGDVGWVGLSSSNPRRPLRSGIYHPPQKPEAETLTLGY